MDGARTGTAADYYELTAGLNFMPKPWLNFRPEIRWDSASKAVFGSANDVSRDKSQLTIAFDVLLKF